MAVNLSIVRFLVADKSLPIIFRLCILLVVWPSLPVLLLIYYVGLYLGLLGGKVCTGFLLQEMSKGEIVVICQCHWGVLYRKYLDTLVG